MARTLRIPLTDVELNVGFARRAAETPEQPAFGELGGSGTDVWGGIVQGEYNPELAGDLRWPIYDRMLRTDPQVRTLRKIVTLPIRAAVPSVKPAGDGATDQEAAQLVETNLLSGMTMTYDDVIRHALLAYFWGFVLLEKVLEERDGYVMWRKLPGRHPRTVKKWVFDENGGVAGIVQSFTDANGTLREPTIPIDRLLLFTWEEYFDNPEGEAELRAVYKPWFTGDWVYKILNIGLERFWLNIPLGEAPHGATKEQIRKTVQLLMGIRAHEKAALVQPHGWKFGFMDAMQRSGSDIALKWLEHQNHQILLVGLAQFLMLGVTDTGSRAVSEDHSDMFLRAEDAVASWICEVVNRYAIPQLCRYNFPGLDQYPQLVIPPMSTVVRQSAMLQALVNAVNAALVSPDADIENALRAQWGFPEVEAHVTPDETEPSEEPEEDDDPPPSGGASAADATEGPRTFAARAPNAREQRFRLDRVRAAQQDAEDALGGDLGDTIEQQLDSLARTLQAPVTAAVAGGAQARNRLLKTLARLQMPLIKRYSSLLRLHLEEIASEGAETVAAVTKASPGDLTRRLRPQITASADALADKHAADILFAVRDQVPRDVEAGLTAETVIRNVRQAVRDRATIGLREHLQGAAEGIAQGLTSAQGA